MKRGTIGRKVSIQGKGLHRGKDSMLVLYPAQAGEGIKFRRLDMDGGDDIPADLNYVFSTTRGTSLMKGEAVVHTVEHILAAMHSCGVNDAIIGITESEVPIMNGSARDFIDLIEKAGVVPSDKEIEVYKPAEFIHFVDSETGSEYFAMPSDHLEILAMIDYPGTTLSSQYAELREIGDFKKEISRCRTFVLLSEIEGLFAKQMIKGGSADTAIIINDLNYNQDQVNQLAERLGFPGVSVRDHLDPSSMLFDNEPARHKIMDILGDLTLIGQPVHARIIAKRPGHKSNIEFAKILKKAVLEEKRLRGKPVYDADSAPVFDLEGIKSFLPHRYPFLLVDKIIELTDSKVVGVKNVTFNEAFFQGHFPGNPIFPGVLQMEALAQTGGILALSNVESPADWDTYFLKMDNVKFKNKVVPGDTLLLKMELLSPIRRGIVHMQGTAYVGNRIVSEGELVAQIIKAR